MRALSTSCELEHGTNKAPFLIVLRAMMPAMLVTSGPFCICYDVNVLPDVEQI